MMTEEEAKIVKTVYNRFITNEEARVWDDIDDNLEMAGWLTDEELIREVELKFLKHSKGIRCTQNHKQEICIAPLILEASLSIVSLFEKTGALHEKNRYILTYYLTMSELNLIFSVDA